MAFENKILLAGLDLDGTLLKNDKTISAFTAAAMRSARTRGIQLVPVTGRPLSGIPKCVTELGVCDYAITTNGAAITDLKTGKRVYSAPIGHEKTVLLMKTLEKNGVLFEAFANGFGFLKPELMERYDHKYKNTPVGDYIHFSRKIAEDPLQLFSNEEKCADEIFISCKRREERDRLAEKFAADREIQLCRLEDTFLEITRRGAEKGTAFLHLCALLGIDRKHTAAFGDNANDLSLVKAAGVFIAMGNAAEEFKSQANVVADTNEQDGVAKMLNKF